MRSKFHLSKELMAAREVTESQIRKLSFTVGCVPAQFLAETYLKHRIIQRNPYLFEFGKFHCKQK